MRNINKKINKVFRIGQTYMNKHLEPYCLSSGLFYFILELSESDGLTMQELSRAVSVDSGYTTRAVNKLIALGFVKKEVQAYDQRISKVFLTDSGKQITTVIIEVMKNWIDIITKNIPEQDIATVGHVFDSFFSNIQEYSKKEEANHEF